MDLLLSVLNGLSEYKTLVQCCQANVPAAVTGLSQIHRTHMIAALIRQLDRPAVIICQDDLAVSRTAEELQSFLGCGPVATLPEIGRAHV